MWAWHWIGYAVAAIGLLVLVRVCIGDRSRGRRRCGRCWYDLSHAGEPPVTCSECGRVHTTPRQLTRTRRSRPRTVVALLLLAAGYGSWTMPRVLDRGWRGAVPTTALVVAAPWLPRAWENELFYVTGEADEPYEHPTAGENSNVRVNLMSPHRQAHLIERMRINAQSPSNLAEELSVRWATEPPFVKQAAIHLWTLQQGVFGFPLHWKHGEERIQIFRIVHRLRGDAYHKGHLSGVQGVAVRRDQLATISPRLNYLGAPDRVGIRGPTLARFVVTPDVVAFESRLLEGAAADAVLSDRASKVTRWRWAGKSLGPIDVDAPSVIVEVTLRDADGGVVGRHVVTYAFEIDKVSPQKEQNVINGRRTSSAGEIWPVEVDGQPVRVPTRAHAGAPLVYEDR